MASNNTRRLTILCNSGSHNFCVDGCDCTCHAEIVTSDSLPQLAYEMWRARGVISRGYGDHVTVRARIRALLSNAENEVDFQGHNIESLEAPLVAIVSRDYWSLSEAAADLGIPDRF